MLSVVIPVHNSRLLAQRNVALLHEFLPSAVDAYELIVVDDGSHESEAIRPGDLPPGTMLVRHERNRGKGAAVKSGMSVANGDCCLFTDVDLPYDLQALPYAYRLIVQHGIHAVVGDRTLPDSEYMADVHLVRRVLSLIFSRIVTLLVIGGIFDSQCGLKAFSRPLATTLFPLLRTEGFAFDVEIFYLLLKNNIMIRRIPVRLRNHGKSSVSVVGHGPGMMFSVFKILLDFRRGAYRSEALRCLENTRYWQ
jgi:glycosyltransferase involved in cell wall biosynthesis